VAVFRPRPRQVEVLQYTHGTMGVSAVPGSGKTQTLSLLAAQIISGDLLADDQEVLVVTLVNSAVDNFANRVGGFVQDFGLLPNLGYRVRTLHGLSNDIVRERPDLVGLSDDFQIVDERAADQIREDASLAWLRSHPNDLDEFIDPDFDEKRRDWVRRDRLPDLASSIALSFIRYAKDRRLEPDQIREQLEDLPVPLPLAQMGCDIYTDYQRALTYRGAVDFDDLIRYALRALESDPSYLERLQYRWPYILEDEAQDSSQLQEIMLRKLAGPQGNWVRVGDPNQAIFETFTTADPKFLRRFMDQADFPRQLPNSGRSTHSIIDLANFLIDWTQTSHPTEMVQDALAPPYIEPTPPGDPQPNPVDQPEGIFLVDQKYTAREEIMEVADSLERRLPDHRDATVAVLVPRNQRGFEMVNELKRRQIEVVELLRSTSPTRLAAGSLGNVINALADPKSPRKLATAYKVWRREDRHKGSATTRYRKVAETLRKCRHVEDYLWPHPGRDWLEDLQRADLDPAIYEELLAFREIARRWQGTALLPIDQIILTLAQDLFTEPTELAIAHKLAVTLRRLSEDHQEWRLPDLTEELAVIARNERRFLGFSDQDTGFEPERHRGKVVVATMHKAKGLEWDRVYLMSVNNYDFPSGLDYDRYISEPWYLRGHLNLEAEALSQLDHAFSPDLYEWYQEGVATQQARIDYVAERLRLLYVAITRAKQELVITWNTGRQGNLQPAIPFLELQNFWGTRLDRTGDQDPSSGKPSL
jgi:DNA helicase-2/ATP-dependent DNA helicase PcrA